VYKGTTPKALAINPVNGKICVANYGSNNVTMITPIRHPNDTKLNATSNDIINHTTTLARPALTGKCINHFNVSPTTPLIIPFNRINTTQQSWNRATIGDGIRDSFEFTINWGTDSLVMGENFVATMALEANAATTNNIGLGTPYTGNVSVYPVYRIAPTTTATKPFVNILTGKNAFEVRNGLIQYSLTKKTFVNIKLFDFDGRQVCTVIKNEQTPGNYTIPVKTSALAKGCYILSFESGNITTKEMIVVTK
jgi:DNA-binding beta-propeller fold protein YncE